HQAARPFPHLPGREQPEPAAEVPIQLVVDLDGDGITIGDDQDPRVGVEVAELADTPEEVVPPRVRHLPEGLGEHRPEERPGLTITLPVLLLVDPEPLLEPAAVVHAYLITTGLQRGAEPRHETRGKGGTGSKLRDAEPSILVIENKGLVVEQGRELLDRRIHHGKVTGENDDLHFWAADRRIELARRALRLRHCIKSFSYLLKG